MAPDSIKYTALTGEPDLAAGPKLHWDNFADSWRVARDTPGGEGFTWWPDPPGRAPAQPLRLDYCFVSPDLALSVERVWVDGGATGSGHRPHWAELRTEG